MYHIDHRGDDYVIKKYQDTRKKQDPNAVVKRSLSPKNTDSLITQQAKLKKYIPAPNAYKIDFKWLKDSKSTGIKKESPRKTYLDDI